MKRMNIWILMPVMLLTLAGCRKNGEVVASGRVEQDTMRLGSKVGGRIATVHAQEGQRVAAGTLLIELEAGELQAQLAQARAAEAQAAAQLALLLAGTRAEDIAEAESRVAQQRAQLEMRRRGFRDEEIREAQAQRARAEADHDLALREAERGEELYAAKSISDQERDRRRATRDATKAALDAAREREALYKSGTRAEEIAIAQAQLSQAEAALQRLRNGARTEEIAAQRAAHEAARANVARLEELVAELRIVSPVEGIVQTLDHQPGDLLTPNAIAVSVQRAGAPWVRCYLPQARLPLAAPGAAVTVRIDGFAGRSFAGKVRRVNAEAEFTPRNVQTNDKRAELVFDVKVDLTDAPPEVRPGMFADVVFVPAP